MIHQLVNTMTNSPLFGVLITLFAFYLGQQIYQRSNRVQLFQPVVVGMIIVIGSLLLFDISYERYYRSSELLHILLGPATVALAIPLFQNAKRIRELLLPIICTVLVGGSLTISIAVGTLWLMGASDLTLLSMTTKSITTPIAMIVSEEIGGIPALSAMFVLITGALGAIVAIPMLNMLGIKDQGVRGFTLGLTSHAIGTARALEENEECGAFSALAMGITGVSTALLLPYIITWF